MDIIQNCPVCNQSLEAVFDDRNYFIDWYCSKCGIRWSFKRLSKLREEKVKDQFKSLKDF